MTATQEYFAEKLKLWTGMFLMFYCVTHYLNHSVGMESKAYDRIDVFEQNNLTYDG